MSVRVDTILTNKTINIFVTITAGMRDTDGNFHQSTSIQKKHHYGYYMISITSSYSERNTDDIMEPLEKIDVMYQ